MYLYIELLILTLVCRKIRRYLRGHEAMTTQALTVRLAIRKYNMNTYCRQVQIVDGHDNMFVYNIFDRIYE